jgi:hypothetical protein
MENAMVSKRMASMTTIIVCLSMLVTAPVNAQSSTAPTFQDATSQHHQRIYQILQDDGADVARRSYARAAKANGSTHGRHVGDDAPHVGSRGEASDERRRMAKTDGPDVQIDG